MKQSLPPFQTVIPYLNLISSFYLLVWKLLYLCTNLSMINPYPSWEYSLQASLSS